MPKAILIGIDGSVYSTAAVDLGIQWAKKYDSILVGLGIIDEPTIRKPEPVPIGGSAFKEHRDSTLLEAARNNVQQHLDQFAQRCSAAGVDCKLLKDIGLPADKICLEAQRYDLIMLGKQTYYHSESQSRPDETLSQVLQSSPRPVVTVPSQIGNGNAIVIAYDGSLQAARTLQAFQSQQLVTNEEIHVVSVHTDPVIAARHADCAVEFLSFHAIQAKRHVVTSASPAQILLEQVNRLGAGLLVMGAYGQPKIREFLFGSVTRTVLSETKVPIFLYH